jgi:CRP-like cAMP-binding protein
MRRANNIATMNSGDSDARGASHWTRTNSSIPVEHGDIASSAYFIIDGSATAGIPEDDGYRGLSTMSAGDFFGEIAALTGSPRTADVVADTDTTLMEVPAEALRATMAVPDIQKLLLATLSSRLVRTQSADLPRLAGVDQESLRDLRTPRPTVEPLPRTYAGEDPG